MPLNAPFPYFGGKSAVAELVWERFGQVANYVEPFFGSGAVLLGRPGEPGTETVNDKDGFVANFWRALQAEPETVAAYADWPVNENDLHARHAWLVGRKDSLQSRLEGDPEWFCPKVAGWWAWGMCCWIGGGFCSGTGPWKVKDGHLVDDRLTEEEGVERRRIAGGNRGPGVNRQLAHAGDAGRGINRQLVHAGSAGRGINRQLVRMGDAGKGRNRKLDAIKRRRPQLAGWSGKGVLKEAVNENAALFQWFIDLSYRLRRVRVCCGDWSRVCGPSVTHKHGVTAVFLDPPYSHEAGRDPDIYRMESSSVAHDVRTWALEEGTNPLMRIALCGYEGEHELPGWTCVAWKAKGGYGSQNGDGNENCRRERI